VLSHNTTAVERRVRGADGVPPGPGSAPVVGGSQTVVPTSVLDPARQYAVLLLNEEQVAQLLQRPSMRPVNHRLVPVNMAFDAYARLMQRARIVMATLAIVIAGASAWAWAPLPVLSAFPWTTADAPPAIATGASFSLTVASAQSANAAADMARRFAAAGTPSFVRTAASTHHVMVGPYVSLDEVEAEQRQLARAGTAGTRVFVDDNLRKATANAPVTAAPGNPAMVLVSAGKHLSLALEFQHEPRQVATKRGADGTVIVEMGPIETDVEPQEWSAPAGVDLIRQVKLEEIAVARDARQARATLSLPRSTMASARVEGRRVYIDLMPAPPPPPPAPAPAPASRPLAATSALAPGVARVQAPVAAPAVVVPVVEEPRPNAAAALRPVLARFERLVPFLQAAARTPAPDVLRALVSNVDELEASLRQVATASDTADAHAALTSALASARRTVEGTFGGDRVAEAHQAGMLVEAAKTVLPATPAQ
jgi:hypothetical protein